MLSRPSTSRNYQVIAKVNAMVMQDCCVTTLISSVAFVMLCGTRDRSCVCLHHDNASTHSLHLIQTFLTKNQTHVVCQAPCSPYMAPCNFWLFPKLKRPLKGNLTRALNSTSPKSCFPSPDAIDRWEKIHPCI